MLCLKKQLMVILADTNIWRRFFREGQATLSKIIEHDFLAMHPLVIGELAVGNLPNRQQTLSDLNAFPPRSICQFQRNTSSNRRKPALGKRVTME